MDVMNTLRSSDTSEATERVLFDLAREAPAWRKVELMGEMYRTVCDLALSGLRNRYPHSSENELRRRLADAVRRRQSFNLSCGCCGEVYRRT
jgi:hypothetical protein